MSRAEYKVLMTTTAMNIGGGETHLIELAKELTESGCTVTVVSNSDVFGRELSAFGIGHIYAPFHSRKYGDIRAAKKILTGVIKTFRPDIVHAHARIPAFISHGVCKKLIVPFVTTTHGTYKVSPILKFLTKWGDYCLSVSDDISEYLVKNYKVKRGYIKSTVNGVNTSLFSESPALPDGYIPVRQELSIPEENKVLLSVSRLDSQSSYAAKLLCLTALRTNELLPDSNIVIVGDGDYFSEIKRLADEVNRILGKKYIILTGMRTDIWRFMAGCDIFAGISRSALEAIASGKYTLLYGDMGCLGRFSREIADKAAETNFTCRGCGFPADAENDFLRDIKFYLDSLNRTRICEDIGFGLELVENFYSSKKMAQDALDIYAAAIKKYSGHDFILTGYYGHDNTGDDALLFSIINNITKKGKNYKIRVLAKNPKKLQKKIDSLFMNVSVRSRFNIFHVRKSIKQSKALVFGGGTLLQDNTSTKSLLYYLYLINFAKKCGIETFLYANGIGPVYLEKNKDRVRSAVSCIGYATLRDNKSHELISSFGMDEAKMAVTADEAVTIYDCGCFEAGKHDFRSYIKEDYFVVSVRKWKEVGVLFFGDFAAAVNNISKKTGLTPVYVVMEPRNDLDISTQLVALGSKPMLIDTHGNIEKILSVVNGAKAVISMRLHMLIFAAAAGVPCMGVAYDPKVTAFMEELYGTDEYTMKVNEFDKVLLCDRFLSMLKKHTELSASIALNASEMKKRAAMNSELLCNFIEKI